jgi:DNA polymerase-3 subunit gamma/tau
MTYQVLARKYRPQRFDDVIGQRGVTQTLRNAITTDRVAQAFVFAGPRGTGKTTTARILARALNCENGPTSDPCGTCDACVEISENRDIDVLEIDGATHTGIDNVREVIIAGLAIAPVRDRYKIFIIDEVHQLSTASFNALLKSIEEPPAHVIFMMATTKIEKIPETVLSRSQVYEFRTIGTQAIAEQLLTIAKAEAITINDAAIALIARSADGSMRDGQSALDQVIAFAGDQITVEAVSTVLGLIGRDPVLDVVEVVANEDPSAVFDLAARFVEAGYDLRLVCRELSRVVRDLLVIAIDPDRVQDPEIAGEGERDRLVALSKRFSREDLLRAFDVLARAEFEIRGTTQPRYHFEMALLKWIYLRRLVPLTELLKGGTGTGSAQPSPGRGGANRPREQVVRSTTVSAAAEAPVSAAPSMKQSQNPGSPGPAATTEVGAEKTAILAEVKRAKKFFYGTVVAQAQRIEFSGNRLVFSFSPTQKTLALQLGQSREWLEALASKVTGRKVAVATEQRSEETVPESRLPPESPAPVAEAPADGLQEKALNDRTVQAMLEVFPAEIKNIEKL